MQILEARVHARQQICLLNSHMLSLHFRKRYHCLNLVRTGYVRNYRGKIKFELDGVVSVRVSSQFVSILPPDVDIVAGVAGATLGAAPSRSFRIRELGNARAQ